MDYYRPPDTQSLAPGDTDDPEASAIRTRNARPESWVRGLGFANYIVGVLWAALAAYYVWIAVGIARGTFLNPWGSDALFAFFTAAPPLITMLSFVAGYGLYHGKRWASAAEAGNALASFAFFGLAAAYEFAAGRPHSGLATILFALLISAPVSILFMPGIDEVLSPDYPLVLAAAPSIRSKTRLPLPTVLAIVALAVAYVFVEWIA